MAQLVLIGLIILALLGIRRLLRNTPLAGYSATRQTLIGLGILLLLVLVLTGRLGVLIPALGAVLAALFATVTRLLPLLIPLLIQNLPRWRRYRQQGGDATGAASSTVQSRYLRMRLQHATGDLSGEILEGPHAGRGLSDLELPELADLYRVYARNDPESARLLNAYIDRLYGNHWNDNGEGQKDRVNPAQMDKVEAYEILGLPRDASREDIINAHRRLIQKLHPDRGGSDYLAAKINQAKDLLLGD
jgi:hypothetical protein